MEKMVNVYFFGKQYSVPADLTIMAAMEYAGYTLKRGCGCRHLAGLEDEKGIWNSFCMGKWGIM